MSTLAQLDLAERMEEVAARLYRHLAAKHAGNPEARGLFEHLAAEEDQHILRVKMVRTRYLRDQQSIGPIALDLSGATRAVLEAEAISGQITATAGMTLAEAKRLASRLEQNMAQAHAEMLTQHSSPELRAFLQTLASQDLEHTSLLQ